MTEPEQTTPEPEPVDDDDDSMFDDRAREALTKLRKENHGLRSRLRDSEEQVGIASARLSAHHKSVIESAAKAAGLIDGSDIWSAQPDPNAFLDEQFHDVVDAGSW